MGASDGSGGFGIEIDEELLQQALSAVERAGERAEGPEQADEGAEIELELPAEATAERGEATRLREALRQAEQETARLKGAQRRLEEQAQRAEQAAREALAARRATEEGIAALKRRVEQLESDQARLRERRLRDLEEQRLHGNARLLEGLLPVLDNLELALAHRSADPEVLLRGVQMILEQFHQCFHQAGVQRVVGGRGVLFDPAQHEAVSEIPTEDLLPGTIVEELRPGYLLNGRLLRAARVTVAGSMESAGSSRGAEDPDPQEAG